MILVVPLFFFLLCLLDVFRGCRVTVEKKPVKQRLSGLERLDFVSEAHMDLDALRSRYSVKYVYVHED